MFINQKKKQYICAGRKKKITGIIVNERPNTPVGYRKRIRQEMHYIAKFGLVEVDFIAETERGNGGFGSTGK